MTKEQALIPMILEKSENKILANTLFLTLGVALISVLAQVSIPLPWTPVPITGQTFGVTLIALTWGRRRAVAVVASYLVLGSLGLPIFALGKAGLALGPTSGYLVGMCVAAYWVGFFADRGWTQSFFRAWAAAAIGSAIIFACGVAVLALYLPVDQLLMAGVIPFLPGDLIKTLLACSLVKGIMPRSPSQFTSKL